MDLPNLTYNADGLIPCIVQDADTLEVLMMAWMSAESARRGGGGGCGGPQPAKSFGTRAPPAATCSA